LPRCPWGPTTGGERPPPRHRPATNLAAVNKLLGLGASVDATNLEGETPLHAAVRSRSPSCIAALLGKGASVYARSLAGYWHAFQKP
jgi:ankyrin repeat protein